MIKKLLFSFFLLGTIYSFGQNLHTQSNAASVANEVDGTDGWTGLGTITSDNTEAHTGNFSIKVESTNNNGRTLQYTFNAVIGQDYTITIWAKEGPQVSANADPAFANWAGFSGFSTTVINGTDWTEYVFNVTATSTTPIIRIYTTSWILRNTAGNSVIIDSVSILAPGSDTEAPSAISDLSASNISETGADLSWSPSTDNVGVTNYEVFQDGVSIANTGTTNTFNVTGLTPSTSYDFTVFAEDVAGNVSLVSNTETVLTAGVPDTEAPSAVTSLVSANVALNSTDLSWGAATDNVGVTNYEIFQDGVSIGNTGATSFSITGLTEQTSYNFTVFAQDAAGNISAGRTVTVVTLQTDTEAPNAITDLAINGNVTPTATSLTWSDPGDNVGVTLYWIFQDGNPRESVAASQTFYNVFGLTPNSNYVFTVFAHDALGNISDVSNALNVDTPPLPDFEDPSPVADLTSSNTTSTSTSLSWSASTDNIGVTNYEVFQDGVSIANTGTTTTLNVNGLTPSTSYDFTVFAQDAAANNSAVSNTETVTTSAGGGTIDYTSENSNMTTVDWTARDLFADRNVGIGTTNTQGYRLAVAGNVIAEGVKVELQGNWPDFVFENDFELLSLDEVRKFILEHGHLPNIPSAEQVEESGIDLGEMDSRLLQKIEELTLYLLKQQSQIEQLTKEVEDLRSKQ